MKLPISIASFAAAWVTMLFVYGGLAVLMHLSAAEPDIKFGDNAWALPLVLFGGGAGFCAALAAFVVGVCFDLSDERAGYRRESPPIVAAIVIGSLILSPLAWVFSTSSWLSFTSAFVLWIGSSVLVFYIAFKAIVKRGNS